jgi:hypothetical protein
MAKRKRPPSSAFTILFFPIIVILWTLGWTLYWTGSKKQPPRRTGELISKKEDKIEIRPIPTEEIQEHT